MTTSDAVEVAADIVTAFISNNSLPANELPTLLAAIHETVRGLNGAENPAAQVAEKPVPAVSIRASITPDHLICLEDGKPFKSLRRHLTHLGMTPETYRAKWGLPATYPMVAANFAAKRSALAKTNGLGRARGASVAAEPATVAKSEAVAPVSPAATKRKPGRPRKAAG